MRLRIVLSAVCLGCGFSNPAMGGSEGDTPVSVIFDTDMDTDCDDAGALAMLHALADRGEVRILATVVSSKYPYSAPCVEAINRYHGRPDLPIGVPKGKGASTSRGSRYADKIAAEFHTELKTNDDAPNAATVYRKVLAGEEDRSIVIVTVGYLTNLRDLLETGPDAISPLSGRELVEKKVTMWSCMGGRYPEELNPRPNGNFKPDPESAVSVVREWPGPIYFSGDGNRIQTGRRLRSSTPSTNPVRRIYELYLGENPTRASWDQVALLYATRPHAPYWDVNPNGHNHIFPNGTNQWRSEPDDPRQRVVAIRPESRVGVQETIDRLMAVTPEAFRNERPWRPNIIFLLTDDQRADTLSCVGHPVVRTPHLDRLASEGALFTQAYVVEPTCMPSRASFLLSQYERTHRVGFSSSHDLTEEQWAGTYPAILRAHGYYVGFVGKLGLERYSFRGSPLEKFDYWRGHDGWARFWPKGQAHLTAYDDSKEDIITPIMGESVDRFLDQAPEGQPFCLSLSFSAPHGSISGSMLPDEQGVNRMTRPANSEPRLEDHPIYGSLYRGEEIRLPATYTKEPGRYIPSSVLPQSGRRQTYSYDYAEETCREHHVRYYQLIRGLDETIGGIRESLHRRGLADDTIIIFSSDHGLLLGDYGMGGKALLYDLTTRVPFIVYDPRLPLEARGRSLNHLVLSIDVAPTILSYAGIEPPQTMQGRSLRGLLENPGRPWREDIFLENLYVGRSNPLIEAVRTPDWKYVRYFKRPGDRYQDADVDFSDQEPFYEQLFDLKNDPGELRNEIRNSAHAEVLGKLRARCRGLSSELVGQSKG